MELTTLHRRAVQYWAAGVAAVRDDQWGDPTPCVEWSVRDLVNHVVAEELWTAPLLRGATIQEVGSQFDGDVLGGDPRARARTAANGAQAAVGEAVPRGGRVQLSYGEEDMQEYVRQLCADHLIHGWDLAAAAGAEQTPRWTPRAVWEQFFGDTKDPEFTDEDTFLSGDRACVRWRFTWTNDDGSQGHVRGVDVIRLRDGLVSEKLSYVKG